MSPAANALQSFVAAILPEDPEHAQGIRSETKVFGKGRGRVDAPLEPGGQRSRRGKR
jgi:hypothetical protein